MRLARDYMQEAAMTIQPNWQQQKVPSERTSNTTAKVNRHAIQIAVMAAITTGITAMRIRLFGLYINVEFRVLLCTRSSVW